MAPFKTDNWIRRFDVCNPKRHKKGFTVYQITSIVYPKQFPEAVTRVVVWKRYNDFKKLHQELKTRHQNLHLPGTFPVLMKSSYFKRFDEAVIEERRRCILELLDFVAQHSPLFTSPAFVKFFQSGYILPDEEIHCPRSEEDLLPPPLTPQSLFDSSEPNSIFESPEAHLDDISEDPSTFGDEDSDTGAASLPFENEDVSLFDPLHQSSPLKERLVEYDLACKEVDFHSETGAALLSRILPEDVLHQNSHCNLEESSRERVQNQNVKEFDTSFFSYQTALANLLKEFHDEPDGRGRHVLEQKTASYFFEAECNNNITDEIIKPKSTYKVASSEPVSELLKFRVLGVVDQALLVLDTEDGACYIMKIVYKSPAPRPKQTIIPQNIPYMVPLYRYYETDDALFLLLKYASGGKLWDHIRGYFRSLPSTPVHPLSKSKKDLGALKLSVKTNTISLTADNSYLELIQEYRTTTGTDPTVNHVLRNENERAVNIGQEVSSNLQDDMSLDVEKCFVTDLKSEPCDGDTSDLEVEACVKNVSIPDLQSFSVSRHAPPPDLLSHSFSDNVGTDELVLKAQELLESVNQTLKKSETAVCNSSEKLKSLSKDSCVLKDEVVSRKESVSSIVSSHTERSRRRFRRRCSTDGREGLEGFSRTRSGSLDRSSTFQETVTRLPEATVRMWASELLIALDTLHHWGIICKDLRPDNVLLGDGGHILLTYHCQWSSVDKLHNMCRPYAAPELSEVFNITPSVDWWSFGVLLYELLTGRQPSHVGGILEVPDFVSPDARSLLLELLKQDPVHRLGSGTNGAQDIKRHPFFTGIDWKLVLHIGALRN